jgi:branched-chain amino acid transport system substrate-binding protein
MFLANRAMTPLESAVPLIPPHPTASALPAAVVPVTTTPRVATAAKTLKVAVLAPLSGDVPTFGVSTRAGALLAIDEWNAKGGVLGMQIEAIVEDSQCSADPAVAAANKVIDSDGVHYIVGEVCSNASIPVSEIAEVKGVVQISPTSTNVGVTLNVDGTTKKYVFRACFIDPFQGTVGAKFAMMQGFKTAFIMVDPGNDYVRVVERLRRLTLPAAGRSWVRKATRHRIPTSRPFWPRSPKPSPTLSTCRITTTSSTW